MAGHLFVRGLESQCRLSHDRKRIFGSAHTFSRTLHIPPIGWIRVDSRYEDTIHRRAGRVRVRQELVRGPKCRDEVPRQDARLCEEVLDRGGCGC